MYGGSVAWCLGVPMSREEPLAVGGSWFCTVLAHGRPSNTQPRCTRDCCVPCTMGTSWAQAVSTPERVSPYPGCWAALSGTAAAARYGDAVPVSLPAPPVLPAQTAGSTCRYGDGSCQLPRQCR